MAYDISIATSEGAGTATVHTLVIQGSVSGSTSFSAGSTPTPTTYTWPAAPVNGNFLSTDGSGTLSWAAVTTPSLTQVLTVGNSSGTNDIVIVAGQQITWNSDASISRNAPGVVQFGTNAANSSGSWIATTGTLTNDGANNNSAIVLSKSPSGAQSGNALKISTSASITGDAVRIATGGANPATEVGGFSVYDDSSCTQVTASQASTTRAPQIITRRSRGTHASPSAALSGDQSMRWIGQSYTAGGTFGNNAFVTMAADGSQTSSSDCPGRIEFWTVPSGSGTEVSRWCIDNVGFLKGTSGLVVGWVASSTDPTGALTAGFSRLGSASVGLGNGSAGDTTGTLTLSTTKVADGAAGTPSYTFGSASTTGMYITAGPTLSWAVGGSEMMTLAGFTLDIKTGGVLGWSSRGNLQTQTNARLEWNAGGGGGTPMFLLGGNTSSFPALKQSSTTMAIRLADDSADASISALNASLSGKVTNYSGVATTGWGIPAVYASGRSDAQTAAVGTVATYTVGGSDGSFLVSANVNVTAYTVGTFTTTVSYTDETNTPQTLTLNFSTTAGTLGTAIAAAGAFEGIPLRIRAKSSTSITVATTGTFTTLTYNVEADITQVS